ncbi:hypothetical protein EC968_009926 [Mortierella alpina]|nr:hypothetical protein EC968_009926 [Mortierella alpina]
MSRSFQEDVRTTLNESAHRQDSTFKLKYFKLHGIAYTSRLILATSGAKWECVFPDDWANVEKQDTHFGFLPILYETTASNQTIEVPESEAIENYLSKKFKLLGADDYDEVQIRAFASSIQALITYYFLRVAVVRDEAYKAVMKERFLTEALPPFVANHERHLKAAGSNGHYVGNKLSIADLKLTIAISMIINLTGDEFVSKERTPAMWAVWESVNAIPSYVDWKSSTSHEACQEGNMRILGF